MTCFLDATIRTWQAGHWLVVIYVVAYLALLFALQIPSRLWYVGHGTNPLAVRTIMIGIWLVPTI